MDSTLVTDFDFGVLDFVSDFTLLWRLVALDGVECGEATVFDEISEAACDVCGCSAISWFWGSGKILAGGSEEYSVTSW